MAVDLKIWCGLAIGVVSVSLWYWFAKRRRPWRIEDESLAGMLSPSALNRRGKEHLRAGDYRRAASAFQRALSLSFQGSDWRTTASTHYHLGLCAQYQRTWSAAIFHYDAALKLYELCGDPAGIAAQYCNLGVVYFRMGEVERSEELHEKSLRMQEALGDDLGMAANYSGLGSILRERQEYEGAQSMHQRALTIFERHGKREGIANQLTALALDAGCLGDTDRALQLYQRARRLFLELHMMHRAEPLERMMDHIRSQQR